MSVRIEQTSERAATATWRWTLALAGTEDELDAVESVTYVLDPTFPDPVRRVSSRADRFRTAGTTASSFHYYATVESRTGAIDLQEGHVEVTDELDGGQPDPGPRRRDVPRVSPAAGGEADGVFEALGPRVRAVAGGLRAADEAGVDRWVNVAGISAGAIAASLLAVGCTGAQVAEVLREAPWKDLVPRRSLLAMSQLWLQGGIDGGEKLVGWLRSVFAASPVAKADVTFGDLKVAPDTDDPLRRHRLRILVSDLSCGRVLTLPDDLGDFEDASGRPLDADAFPLAEAIRMSMALPFQYKPVTLRQDGQDHLLVDGGILSSFPVWLFDAPAPERPTWGMKVYAEPNIEQTEQKGFAHLAGLILNRVMDADAYSAAAPDAARTLRIGTALAPWKQSPKKRDLDAIEDAGYAEGRAFFAESRPYRNSYGASPHVEIVAG